jgi:hypothetical protein
MFKSMTLNFYGLLVQKLACHPIIGHLFQRQFMVLLKGGNSHVYLNGGVDSLFKPSDMDITVCINPFLPRPEFDHIKGQVEIAVRQALSQYKRALDYLLFLNGNGDSQQANQLTQVMYKPILTPEAVEAFKAAFNAKLATFVPPPGTPAENIQFASPCASTDIRNKCSRPSFLLTNSQISANHVVMVEVPHFDRCERIPLRKTPLFCSFNETIDFNRTGGEDTDDTCRGKFNLYRLKMNVMFKSLNSASDEWEEDKVPADFIDVTVPDMDDIELQHFWTRGRSVNVYDKDANQWVTIPDLATSIEELERILQQYESCDAKKEKRMRKLAVLKTHAYNGQW